MAARKVVTSDGIKFNIHWTKIKKKKKEERLYYICTALCQHVAYDCAL